MYHPPRRPGDWPELAGRYQAGDLVPHAPPRDLFAALDEYLRNRRERFKAVFDRFDADASGSLNAEELKRFVTALMPEASPADVRYFHVMLDVDGDDLVTYQEMVEVISECRAAGTEMRASFDGAQLPEPLRRLAEKMRSSTASAKRFFDAADTNRDGALEPRELARVFTNLVPNITKQEMRYALAYLAAHDHSGSPHHKVSFAELQKTLRAVTLVEHTGGPAVASPVHGRRAGSSAATPVSQPTSALAAHDAVKKREGSFSVPSHAPPTPRTPRGVIHHADMEVWTLHEERLGGALYLVDRETDVVYHLPRADGDWPRVAGLKQAPPKPTHRVVTARGRKDAAAARAPAASAKLVELRDGGVAQDLFGALDGFLRTRKQKLQDVFNQFDADRSGRLSSTELHALLKTILPDVSPAQERYFRVMLGVGADDASMKGKGGITFEEFTGAIKEARGAGLDLVAQPDDAIPPAIAALHAFMRANNVSARGVFAACDTDGSGVLDADELRAMVRELYPTASPLELKQVLAGLLACDVRDSGQLDYRDLLRGLRLLRIQRIPLTSAPSKTDSATTKKTDALTPRSYLKSKAPPPIKTKVEPSHGDWTLEYWTDRSTRTEYLLDRATMRAYYVPPTDGHWPRLAGRVSGADRSGRGGVFTPAKTIEGFLASLDAHLKTHQRRIQDVFDEVDADGNGYLDQRELMRLLAGLFPGQGVSEAETLSFMTMLDADGDGHVTLSEILACVRNLHGAANGSDDSMTDAMIRLAQIVSDNGQTVENLFSRMDVNKNGKLDPPELMRLFDILLPGTTLVEKQQLLRNMIGTLDLDGDAKLNLDEMRQGLRLVRLVKVRPEDRSELSTPKTPATGRTHAATPRGRQTAATTPKSPSKMRTVAATNRGRSKSAAVAKKATTTTSSRSTTSTPTAAPLKYPFPADDEWELEEVRVDGRVYLVDESTDAKAVYHNCREDRGEWPVLAGRLAPRTSLVSAARIIAGGSRGPAHIFNALDAFLKEKHLYLRDLFDQHDFNRDGSLDAHELVPFVMKIVPDATTAEVKYFGMMCDINNDGHITYEELLQAIRECLDAAKTMDAQSDTVPLVMRELRDFMATNNVNARTVFEACDLNSNGTLEYHELQDMIRTLKPGVNGTEMRHLIASLHTVDVDGDGNVTYPELLRGLRLAKIKRVPEGYDALRAKEQEERSRGTGKISEKKKPKHEHDWTLHKLRAGKKTFLLDPETHEVYYDCKAGQWPVMYGRYDDVTCTLLPRHKEGASRKDLFHELDEFLKDHRRKLRDVFDEFDDDRDGNLNFHELAHFIQRIIPEVTPEETEYFQIMLDVDGDGQVTFDGMLQTIKEVRATGVSMKAHTSEEEVPEVMLKLQTFMAINHVDARTVFEACDLDNSGFLEYPELNEMIKTLVPGVTPSEHRHLLAGLRAADGNHDGCVSYHELLRFLRLVNLKITEGDKRLEVRERVAADAGNEWVLEHIVIGGRPLLLDPETSQVFTVEGMERPNKRSSKHRRKRRSSSSSSSTSSSSDSEPELPEDPEGWPVLVGRLSSSGRLIPHRPMLDLFDALKAYCQSKEMSLDAVFEKFDVDNRGALEGAELAHLVSKLLPGASDSEISYFQVMLDLNGDERVTLRELKDAVHECTECGRDAAVSANAPTVPEVLRRLAEDIANDGGAHSVRAKFDYLLSSRHGDKKRDVRGLDAFNLVDMLRGMFRRITHAEVRHLIASLRSIDLDGDCLITLPELKRALRIASVQRVLPGEGFTKAGKTGRGYDRDHVPSSGHDSARTNAGRRAGDKRGDDVRNEMDKASGAKRHIERTKSRSGYIASRPRSKERRRSRSPRHDHKKKKEKNRSKERGRSRSPRHDHKKKEKKEKKSKSSRHRSSSRSSQSSRSSSSRSRSKGRSRDEWRAMKKEIRSMAKYVRHASRSEDRKASGSRGRSEEAKTKVEFAPTKKPAKSPRRLEVVLVSPGREGHRPAVDSSRNARRKEMLQLRKAEFEREIEAMEDLHRAKAYERDAARQRREEARRAEDAREAKDRARLAKEKRLMREEDAAFEAAEEDAIRRHEARERRAAEEAALHRHAAYDKDAAALSLARRARQSAARERLRDQPSLRGGHTQPRPIGPPGRDRVGYGYPSQARPTVGFEHANVPPEVYAKWKAEELAFMVEAAGQPLLNAMSTLKRDASGRVAKDSVDAIVGALDAPDARAALTAMNGRDKGRSGDRFHVGATPAIVQELLAEVNANLPPGAAAAVAAGREAMFRAAEYERMQHETGGYAGHYPYAGGHGGSAGTGRSRRLY